MKQNDRSRIKPHKRKSNENYTHWKIKGVHLRICNRLVLNRNKIARGGSGYILKMPTVQMEVLLNQRAKLMITRAHSPFDIAGSDNEEMVALRSPQEPWAPEFLTNLKIWPVRKCIEIGLPSVSCLNNLVMILLYLVKYIKLTIS